MRAVVERDGKQIDRTRYVSLSAGREAHLDFEFDSEVESPADTVLALNVPAEALSASFAVRERLGTRAHPRFEDALDALGVDLFLGTELSIQIHIAVIFLLLECLKE